MNQLVGTAAIAIGIFFSVMPEQAARIWGRRDLTAMAQGAVYRWLYRTLGVLLCLGGLLFAVESLWPAW